MIKISEIINTNKVVSISEKGIKEMEKIIKLLELMNHFDLEQGDLYDNNSKLFHLSSNLLIWTDERVIVPGEKLPAKKLFEKVKKILESFDEWEKFEIYLKELAEMGLINY